MPAIGRPKIEAKKRKAVFLTLRLSEAERSAIEKAASKDKKRATTWAREALLEKTDNAN